MKIIKLIFVSLGLLALFSYGYAEAKSYFDQRAATTMLRPVYVKCPYHSEFVADLEGVSDTGCPVFDGAVQCDCRTRPFKNNSQ